MLMANETSAPARLVLLGGKPIKEPVQQYGPFVMTTPEEVRQAMIDYQVGSGEKQPLSLSLSLTHTCVYIYISNRECFAFVLICRAGGMALKRLPCGNPRLATHDG